MNLWNTFIYIPLVNAFVFLYQYIPIFKLPIAIFLLTIIIRTLVFPLTKKSMDQSRAMQKIQPEIKKLQAKYKANPQKLNEEQMKLFTKHGVNPASGCLFSLIQFPLIIALYPVFMNLSKQSFDGFFGYYQVLNPLLRFEHFNSVLYSFVPKLTYVNFHFFIWELSKPDPNFILPIIAGALQFIQAKQMITKTNDETQKTMNQTMLFMPLLIIMFAGNLAASVALYWIAATIVGIIQTAIIKRTSHDNKLTDNAKRSK
jgi:YidC/Oxa1 family membrane protein insertase